MHLKPGVVHDMPAHQKVLACMSCTSSASLSSAAAYVLAGALDMQATHCIS